MNSWERIEPGRPQKAWESAGGHAIYRATFTPPRLIQSRGGEIVFHRIAGAAEIHLDGVRIAAKPQVDAGPVRVMLPASAQAMTLSLLLRASAAPVAGLVGEVELIGRP